MDMVETPDEVRDKVGEEIAICASDVVGSRGDVIVEHADVSRIISRHVTVVHTVTCHGLNNVYGKDDF